MTMTGCCDEPSSPPGSISLSDYLIQLMSNQQGPTFGGGFIREVSVPDNVAQAFGLPAKLILRPGIRMFRNLLSQDIDLNIERAAILGKPNLVNLSIRDLSVQRALTDVPLPADTEVAHNLTVFHGTPNQFPPPPPPTNPPTPPPPPPPPLDQAAQEAFLAASNFLRALEQELLQKLLDTFEPPVFTTECPLLLNNPHAIYIVVEETGLNGLGTNTYRDPIAAFKDESQALLLVRKLTAALHSSPVTIDFSSTVEALRAIWPSAVKNGISTGFGDIPQYEVVSLQLYSK